jgi:glyoxylase-like metal-dependent hydrolase (beta-lactamase superfamily II)/rhodanese-related sulfurtransferase
MQVETIQTSELGDRSYVVHDGRTAVVVDPQRDTDRVERLLQQRGLTLAAVAETHIHNDYVTGGLELARRTGADYLVNQEDDVSFDRRPVADGEELRYGDLVVGVIATPGHTFHHLSYAVRPATGPSRVAVFTGGSLLYGSVGRTDLLGEEHTETLTRAQFHSARTLVERLGDDTEVFPTHGFGSFCSSGSTSGDETSTIGEQRKRNDALLEDDEDAFVERLVAGLTAYPAYYAHMGARNQAGPEAPDLSPAEPVDAGELRRRIDDGAWVVDLRSRTVYCAGHVPGTVSIELGDQFSTYVGWLLPWDVPITLLAESAEQVATAQRQLVRIGIERPAGAAVGSVGELVDGREPAALRRVSFTELAERGSDGVTVLDVRREDERQESAIPGSAHLPIHHLVQRLDEVPDGQLWVHCASGFRATIAASILERAGHDVVLIDDEYDNAKKLGLAAV